MKTTLNHLKPFIWFVIITFFLSACENEVTDDMGMAEALEGEWKVEEDSKILEESSYRVYIDIYSKDSSSVSISNFYQLGYDSEDVIGDISGDRIELRSNQDVAGYEIKSGNGTITDDYQNIDWQYKVDDGSGEIDSVTAVYTKL